MPHYTFEIEITHIERQTIEKGDRAEAFEEMEATAEILRIERKAQQSSIRLIGETN